MNEFSRIHLERFAYASAGALGRLYLPDQTLFTVEPPWQDNQPDMSCIPEGLYRVRRDKTGKHRWWQVLEVPARHAIEIHPANYFITPDGKQELHGCIAPGLRLNPNHQASVLSSRKACERMLDILGDADWELKITQIQGAIL